MILPDRDVPQGKKRCPRSGAEQPGEKGWREQGTADEIAALSRTRRQPCPYTGTGRDAVTDQKRGDRGNELEHATSHKRIAGARPGSGDHPRGNIPVCRGDPRAHSATLTDMALERDMFPTRHALTSREIAAVWPTATLLAPLPAVDFGTVGSGHLHYGLVARRRSRERVRHLWSGFSALLRPRLFQPRPAGVDGAR